MGLLSNIRGSDGFEEIPIVLDKPVAAPVGLFSSYIEEKLTASAIHENTQTRNQDKRFSVTDVCDGAPIFTTSSSGSLRSHLPEEFYDTDRNHLFTLKKRTVALRQTYDAFSPTTGDVIFTIANPGRLKAASIILTYRDPSSGKEMEITLHEEGKGPSRKRNGVFKLESAPGCPIIGTLTSCPPFFLGPNPPFGMDSGIYYIGAAPGVDMALLTTMSICADAIKARARAVAAATAVAIV